MPTSKDFIKKTALIFITLIINTSAMEKTQRSPLTLSQMMTAIETTSNTPLMNEPFIFSYGYKVKDLNTDSDPSSEKIEEKNPPLVKVLKFELKYLLEKDEKATHEFSAYTETLMAKDLTTALHESLNQNKKRKTSHAEQDKSGDNGLEIDDYFEAVLQSSRALEEACVPKDIIEKTFTQTVDIQKFFKGFTRSIEKNAQTLKREREESFDTDEDTSSSYKYYTYDDFTIPLAKIEEFEAVSSVLINNGDRGTLSMKLYLTHVKKEDQPPSHLPKTLPNLESQLVKFVQGKIGTLYRKALSEVLAKKQNRDESKKPSIYS